MCLSVEFRLRSKHNLRKRKKFKRKYEVEVVEAIHLHNQVFVVEAVEAAWARELDSLREQDLALKVAKLNDDLSSFQPSFDELSTKAATLESQKDSLTDQVSALETTCSGLRDQVSGYELFKEQYEAVQDEQVKMLSDRVAKLDSDLMGMAIHLDEEFYPRFLTTIAGRRGHVLDFNFLSQLESQRDVSITDIIDSLCLEVPSAGTSKINRLQPVHEQLLLPSHQKEDNAVIR
nr:hypothetical protein [Tanacetum cinerariifolium]